MNYETLYWVIYKAILLGWKGRYLELDMLLLKVSPLGLCRYFSNHCNLKAGLRSMQNDLLWIEMVLPLCNFLRHSCWSNPCNYKSFLQSKLYHKNRLSQISKFEESLWIYFSYVQNQPFDIRFDTRNPSRYLISGGVGVYFKSLSPQILPMPRLLVVENVIHFSFGSPSKQFVPLEA